MTVETSQGTLIEVNSAGTFLAIGEADDFSDLGVDQEIIDSTNLRSTWRTRRGAGLADAGEVTIKLSHDPADTGQDRVRTLVISGAAEDFRITLADSATSIYTFSAIVKSFKNAGQVGGKVASTLVLQVSGPLAGF